MMVTLAKTAGFCFGVKRAVEMVYTEVQKGKQVYTLGPIIHNEEVVSDLEKKGVKVINELDLEKMEEDGNKLSGSTVVIRSHGVSEAVYQALEEKKCEIVDSTCPFVKKIHDTVRKHAAQGYDIVIIGSREHPEVQGILGWCLGRGKVLEKEQEISSYEPQNNGKKVCVVAQTTFNYKKFKDLVEIISKKGYDIIAVNTICNATAERQKEAQELAACSDAMIVIGGKNSSNSRKLYEISKNQCESTYFIQTLEDLDMECVRSSESLGITAGASTPKNIIQEVLEACQKKEVLENY
ncbi:MAG: 4-hydroxy-3-methylbut-2-enyl diphosphate reductase [Eubacterium sp.]|jgi:4-hydroxy-3-methylbut-2-enyl diphosphate reductase|nr:4-hydroxy-3-methylbut-2-enyl diphosphate reductase [Eubacterium sp.]